LRFFDRHGIRPGKVLDFGCAFGAFGFDLARRDRLRPKNPRVGRYLMTVSAD
jgi:hypothetical protein